MCIQIAGSRGGLFLRFSWVSQVNISAQMLTFIAAWFGSLVNGPLVDRLGRKRSINLAVVVFVIGSAIQCGAVNVPMLFVGMRYKCRGISSTEDLQEERLLDLPLDN